ncbi:MAG TPA: methyl-accepting chemotaxis protein [Gemmatimonadaceae bacterium]|nr:methyl-accepting chemotaxis protein [Gemmatimonadaceae bacterium]
MPIRDALNSIRGRMLSGFAAMILLLILAGVTARASLVSVADQIGTSLAGSRREAQLTSRLAASVAQGLAAGAQYVSRPARTAKDAFTSHVATAHAAQKELATMDGMSADDLKRLVAIDRRLTAVEDLLVDAHRLTDQHRTDAAIARADSAAAIETDLLADIQTFGQTRAIQIEATSQALRQHTDDRANRVILVIIAAITLGALAVLVTLKSIGGPLEELVEHARALSEGRLDTRTSEELPGEFRELASAMNSTADSLSRIAAVALDTAGDVSESAHQLSSAAEQISVAAGQTASAMSDVTDGAEKQVAALQEVDESLARMRVRAGGMRTGAAEVRALAEEIERSAQEKREEVGRSVGLLSDVRTSVNRAASEVHELDATMDSINRFVNVVGRIAEQTNLLALNAAIEAARAGSAGRGFGVVADEVRKLAEQAREAADDVVQLTAVVSARVASTTDAMRAGSARVSDVEKIATSIDAALTTITRAAERTRSAAAAVTVAANDNATAVETASALVSEAARTAEGHAAAAEQVSASTEQQSAACEEMSAASTALLDGAGRLKQIVAGLRTGS